ncbi:hypothetical protein ACH3O9_13160 [Leeuwenhoekiella sp. A16]|uniref:hypothetical protein n=1 Tax=unclassified Leeuwenhoekiella TaxID=2615029 RepID=UPI003A7FA7B2
MKSLKGQNILFLSPQFFGYEKKIKKALEDLGGYVIWHDERPSNSFFSKVFIRLNFKFLIGQRIKNHYDRIIKETENIKFDYIFLVNPETITHSIFKNFKNKNPQAEFLTYMWDSVKNKKKSNFMLPLVDRFFTFDARDRAIDSKIEFLPLFFIEEFENQCGKGNFKEDKPYKTCFFGTVHSDRYPVVTEISNQIRKKGFKTYQFFYCPDRILFKLKQITDKNFRVIERTDINFKPLNNNEISKILDESDIVIDIEHPDQSGLTMRTIEMLGADKKLITTNKEVVDYDFYNSSNICVVDRKDIRIPDEFLQSDYQKVDEAIKMKYSLKNWLKIIFDLN